MKLIGKSLVAGLTFTLIVMPSAGGAPFVNRFDTSVKPGTIPVRMVDAPGSAGKIGIISMKVGTSAPISVVVDTGSIGLRLWAKKPSGLQSSSPSAYMTFGGIRTTSRVAYQFVGSTSQFVGSTSSSIQRWKSQGIDGVLGIGIGKGSLTNPLMSLPPRFARSWSVHFSRDSDQRGGDLVLGAVVPGNAIMNFPLERVSGQQGEPSLWNDRGAQGCWTFSTPRTYCVSTLFDSFSTVMRVTGREFSRVPTTTNGELRNGTRVTLAAQGNAYIGARFNAGKESSRNLVKVDPRGSSEINTGNSFYFSHVVTYNVTTGDIYLHEPAQKGR
jgi:hypothetical protein